MQQKDNANVLCVYTCIIGDHYTLPNVKKYENVEYVCFTDNENINSNGWKIKKVVPLFNLDPVRSSRYVKILPHKFLKNFSRSLYIDPSVQLIENPISFYNFLINNNLIGAIKHSFRNTIEEVFYKVFHSNLEEASILEQQLKSQILENPKNIKLKPAWNGIIARKHLDPICVSIMELWFYKVLRYSRRDQLSVSEIYNKFSNCINWVELDNYKSQFHLWPIPGYSRSKKYNEYINLIPTLFIDSKKNRLIEEKELEIARLTQVTKAKDQEINEIFNSNSWRITSPLRFLVRIINKLLIK
jgi:hypothetical protein